MSKTICIVDDDSFYAEILVNLLTMQGYQTQHFLSASSALKAMDQASATNAIDAFILDVIMPDIDGYELCEQLRTRAAFTKTPILFVSSKSSLEDRMRGYAVGGNDYLGKPVQPEELQIKLNLAMQNADRSAIEPNEKTKQTPSAADTSALAYPVLIQFMEGIQQGKELSAIAQLLLKTVSQLGANSSVLIRTHEKPEFSSYDGSRHPIEIELLELANQKQGLIEFNNRLIFNCEHLSLLVKQLAVDDPGRTAQIKELLPLLMHTTNSHIATVKKINQLEQQKNHWLSLLMTTEKGLDELRKEGVFKEATIKELSEESLLTLNEDFLRINLDEDQEAYIKDKFEQFITKVNALLRKNTQTLATIQAPFKALHS